jgi:hemerythrin-like domain-containing protein
MNADKFHHAKEEDVLFKYFDEGIEIIKVMHEDHTAVRALRKAIRDAVETKDKIVIARDLEAYRELLIEHIRKEDEILFPWLDGQMSNDQTNEMFSKFIEIDKESKDTSIKYEQFILKTERRFGVPEAV